MVDGGGRLRPHWRGVLGAYAALAEELRRPRQPARSRRGRGGVAACCRAPRSGRPGAATRCRCRCRPAEFAALAAGLDQRARAAGGGARRPLRQAAPAGRRACCRRRWCSPIRPSCGRAATSRTAFGLHLLCRRPDPRRRTAPGRVLADRTDCAAGLGLARENRRLLARVLPEPFRPVQVRQLRPFFELWQDSLHRLAPPGRGNPVGRRCSREGAAHPHWFEHMLLARDLGGALVEPGDLTVRNGAVFLKTLRGLQPVDVLLRRLAGRLLDPLELDGGPLAGVPGLLDAARGGSVRIVNDPGGRPAGGAGLRRACCPRSPRRLLGEPLQPERGTRGRGRPRSPPGWWASGWSRGRSCCGSFSVHDGEGWRTMPGGLARVLTPDAPDPAARSPGALPASALAKDVWVLAEDRADVIGLAPCVGAAAGAAPHRRRSAEPRRRQPVLARPHGRAHRARRPPSARRHRPAGARRRHAAARACRTGLPARAAWPGAGPARPRSRRRRRARRRWPRRCWQRARARRDRIASLRAKSRA